jgi:hypothetical protein
MEEQAEFSDRLADSSRRKKRPRLARRFADKAQGNRENASILRELLLKTVDEVLEVPLEDSSSEYEDRTGTD